MPIENTTQKVAQAARCAIGHCYICAGALPERGCPAFNVQTSRDHVIPTSILTLAGDVLGSEWPLILDIHRECEAGHKRSRDQMAKVLQVMGASGPRAWTPEELRLLRQECRIERQILLRVAGIFRSAPVWIGARVGRFRWWTASHRMSGRYLLAVRGQSFAVNWNVDSESSEPPIL